MILLQAISEWGQAEPGHPLDVIRGSEPNEEMVRIEDQLELLSPPSAPAAPAEAGNAGSAGALRRTTEG